MVTRRRENNLQELEQELKALKSEIARLEKDASDLTSLRESYDEARELLNALTGNVKDSVLIIDWQGNVLYANESAFRQVDVDPSAGFSGFSIFQFIVPDEHAVVEDNLELIRSGTKGLTTVYKIITSTGRECLVQASGEKITFRGQEADLLTIHDITEHMQIENERRIRQARLDSLFRAVPTGIGIITNHILTDVNDRICEMTGYTRNELLGKSAKVFYPSHEEYITARAENNRQLALSGIAEVETRWRKKDGAVIDVFLRFSQLSPGDLGAGLTFTALDISKRKKIDQSLKESEERYRRITSSITDYIYTVFLENGQPVKTIHSPVCEAITGYTAEELDTDQYLWFTMIYEADRVQVHEHFKRVQNNDDAGAIEHRIVRKDGALRWVSNTPVIHRDDSGSIISYDGVISDITVRKLAEEALRESEVRFRTLLEASAVGILIHDQGTVLDCNQGLSDLTGYTLEELIGMNGLTFIAEKWHDIVQQKALANYEGPYDAEGKRKDGTIFPIEIRGKSMPYNGRSVRVTEIRDITERKQAEEAIRRSEEKLRNIVEHSTNAFYSHTPDNLITYISPQIKKILGFTPGEELRKWTDYLSDNPLNKQGILATDRAIRTGKAQPPYELELLARDGRRVWVVVNESPLVVDGQTRMIVGSLQDITARKQAEQALEESRQLYRSMFEDNRAVMLLISPGKGRIVDANPAACAFYGYSREKLRKMTIDMINTLSMEQITDAIELARAGNKYHFFFRHRLASGSIRDVEVLAAPIVVGGDTLLYSIVHDITERKQAEEALRRNEERFRSLIQNSSDIIVILNEQGVITYETPSVSRILGYEPGHLIGKTPADFIHPDDFEYVASDLREVYDNKAPGVPTEMRFRRADGSWAYLEALGKNLLDYPGINGVVITARDITDRKKSENERIEMERRFQHAQKLESLGVLAGGIAHDFNNLLMAILGNLDLSLIDIPQGSKSQHFISQARMAARRAADLTNQMLAYSGKGRFNLKTFDLSELVEEMTRLLKASISKNVTLSLNLDKSIPFITADPAQIQQIILNLIVNASEAIGEKAGVVSITTGVKDCGVEYLEQSRLKEKQKPGKYIFAEVRDTGCGMDAQTLERLFDPFFSTKFTGRGLGMAAVLGIVKGHKGAIVVNSEIGQGTSIQVLFPAGNLKKAILEKERIDDSVQDALAAEAPLASGTILLVDDEDMVLDLCSAMVQRLGYRALTTSDGKEALEVFRKHSHEIDCIILDLTMPRMDGMKAFEKLKRIRKDVRVIISSGYSEDEVANRFKGKDPAGFIKKPFEFSALRQALDKVLKKE